jgi:hypothetical protein
MFVVSGCGEDGHDEHNHGDLSPAEEACEHMQNGPATSLEISAMSDAPTDTVHSTWEHKRVDLTLMDDGSGESFVGYVTYEAEAAGDYLVFADGQATITINDEQPESAAEVSECSDVVQVQTFELAVGEHVMTVTASTATVRLVVELDGGDGGHDDH